MRQGTAHCLGPTVFVVMILAGGGCVSAEAGSSGSPSGSLSLHITPSEVTGGQTVALSLGGERARRAFFESTAELQEPRGGEWRTTYYLPRGPVSIRDSLRFSLKREREGRMPAIFGTELGPGAKSTVRVPPIGGCECRIKVVAHPGRGSNGGKRLIYSALEIDPR
jgi:hypothetical protein